ncbi:FGGY family carbohydrate kinase [Paracoccus sp. YLB-12]|uniref:FGGY family carbohydrate kinase n=1 Tax=Paracoccus maritimus TaxID=2933292 RepID=A0ABT2KBT2_9RHOB|nr:FGGY family carbohydrate kinase [Paracoccus sp. YLB-12]MCT4333971.1 FGGY family carbohydrate kinase [Paracoccus sp. YLB-12]
MNATILCLDSGTTSVKAAAFDGQGNLLASAERPNGALRRDGVRVEQDMQITLTEAMTVLRDCAAQITGPVTGLILTGQGDGLWPVDRDGVPVGRAMTWLDGRARSLASSLAPQLDQVQAATGSRPTAASASLQLLWLQRHDPDRHVRIAKALRLKEWLFFSLTGQMIAEPTALLPVWGNWRDGKLAPRVQEHLGLTSGLDLLPELAALGAARAELSDQAARLAGLPRGLPVLLGPGDVQSTLIGLGLGTRPDVTHASIFGTSAIHACLLDDPDAMPRMPTGAMIQHFAAGPGYLCFHPCFNGASLLRHLSQKFTDLPVPAGPEYSSVILHPFLEPGGERAPWTDPNASAAIFGLNAATTPGQIAWAGREALAFVTHASHQMMGASAGALSLGGGLAGDGHFARFLATLTGCEVQRSPGAHAGLRGLALIAARALLGATDASPWIGAATERATPQQGAVAAYAQRKYRLFSDLIDLNAPFWSRISDLGNDAETLMESP